MTLTTVERAHLTSFVGRRRQLEEVAALIDDRRLVTITGAGGSGKTRLVQELLSACPFHQAARVDLADVDDASSLIEAVLGELDVPAGPSPEPLRALQAHLGGQDVLLVLDNAEHLVEALGPLTASLLRLGPKMRVLVTSRQPLGLAGETVWRLPRLPEEEAAVLFAERAAEIQPGFAVGPDNEDAVRAICEQLDGLPLAVELAADLAGLLSPAQILERLDDRFGLLVGGRRHVEQRQQSLLASVERSFRLLDVKAQYMLARLAVLAGTFDLAAVSSVAAGSHIASNDVLPTLRRLVDASLVEAEDQSGSWRYRLPETIRLFAADRLAASGAGEELADRHLAHFAHAAGEMAAELEHGDEDYALRRLAQDRENYRAALERSRVTTDPALSRTLTESLVGWWLLGGDAREGLEATGDALKRATQEGSPSHANLWSSRALLATPAGRPELAVDAAARALELAADTGDDRALARAYLAAAYSALTRDFGLCHDRSLAAQRHAEAGGADFTGEVAQMLQMLSLGYRDRHPEALSIADRLLARSGHRHRRLPAAMSRAQALRSALLTGDVRRAVAYGRQAMRIAQPLGSPFLPATVAACMAWALGTAGQAREAQHLTDSVRRSAVRAGLALDVIDLPLVTGRLHLWAGQPAVAIDVLQGAVGQGIPGDDWTSVRALPVLAAALRHGGRLDEAAEAARRGADMARRLGTPHAEAEAIDEIAHLHMAGDPGKAQDLVHDAIAIRQACGLTTHLADSLDRLADIAATLEDHHRAARLAAASDMARRLSGYPRPAIDLPRDKALRHDIQRALGRRAYIDAVNEGESLDLDAALTYATRARGPRNRPSFGWESLTPTEHEVTALVADGLTNPQVADRLFMSRATVKTHLSHIYAKLGIANRTELATVAVRNGSSRVTDNRQRD